MAWLALCREAECGETGRLREEWRDAHFAYVEQMLPRLLVAGPLRATPGGPWRDSLFIYDVETEAEARELLTADPYYQAGIYGTVEFRPFVPAAGRWPGGTLWSGFVTSA